MRSVANHKTTITNSDSTRRGKITYYKQFLKWLVDEGHNQHITRAKIEKITSPQIRPLKTEKDILTHAELEQVLTSAETMRDRVMLMTLYESAGRADEIRLLTWQEVIFFDNYVDITLQSKTEHKRRIPLYLSYLLLKKWKQVLNPTSDDSYVFPLKLKEPYKPFSYDGFLEMVKRTVKRAEVQKKVTPHTFRHTRVTNLLQDGLSEQSVKLLAWGTEHTTMLKTYAHLTHADAKNELHRLYGMNSASSYHGGRSITKPVHCPACDTVNPKINHICAACGAALIQSL
jgi:integrase